MAYEIEKLDLTINARELGSRVHELLTVQAQRYQRLWWYYENPLLPRTVERDEQGSDRPYRQGQEWGLPSRLTGVRACHDPNIRLAVDGVARKEVVVENDIGWRIDTMVDFLFGQPFEIGSLSADPDRRATIEQLLGSLFELHGGGLFFQQLALLSAIHGFVDVLVKFDPATGESASPAGNAGSPTPWVGSASSLDDAGEPGASLPPPSLDAQLARIARSIRLEVIEPARALPVLSPEDWRDVRAYVQVSRVKRKPGHLRSPMKIKPRWFSRVLSQLTAVQNITGLDDEFVTVTEILTPNSWQRYEDESLVCEGTNSLGEISLVHIQNLAVPLQYSGASDVEQLIALQDELNTRLSDRASRITLQSFKMYLGKGIDGFTDLPVAPGRMWVTDNIQAEVIEFGGETSSPSEDQHITELREAMDKTSGVTPIAAGAIRGRIGNLTSAAALRVTMMSLLAKTERRRTVYAHAISQMCEFALAWLDRAGLFHTAPDERRTEVRWPPIMPDAHADQLREAQMKQSLGVPRDVILRELGYEVPPETTLSDPSKDTSTANLEETEKSDTPSS